VNVQERVAVLLYFESIIVNS
jgi:serine/threonine-protein kinase ULK4